MAGITTAMVTSFKQELLQGGHCFNATLTPAVTNTGTTTVVTGITGGASGIAVGMAVTGSSVAASTFVSAITGASALTLSVASTGSNTTLTFTGDVFKMALIKATSTATYNAANNVNYTDVSTLNTDEVSGTGYTAAGTTLVNVTPTVNTTQAITNFSPNPSWVTATFSTIGCMIYNSSNRLGGNSGTNTSGAGRACGVFDFGGTQTVSAGTFTVVMPGASSGSAILRVA